MKSFTIERETNNITVHNSSKEAAAVPNAERFGTEGTLAKLAANWSADRLVEIWNTLPGAVPVRKFRDRKTAVNRIWKAVESLGSALPVAPIPCDLPPEAVCVAVDLNVSNLASNCWRQVARHSRLCDRSRIAFAPPSAALMLARSNMRLDCNREMPAKA